jgi:acetyltransferase-like isoleucine patch superfamily enzyme
MKNYYLYKNVLIGKGAVIQPGVIIGLPPFGKKEGELKTIIGENCFIRSNSVIYAGTKIGNNLQTGHNVVIREENQISENFTIWSNSVLSPGNKIGSNVKIHCNCFVEDSVLEDNVFLGPQVVTVDDLHPVCPRWKECLGGIKIGRNTSIGGNVTILPGVEIGSYVLVGAGSVVTRNISSRGVAFGNPAKVTKKIDDLKCIKKYFDKPYVWRDSED